MGLKLKMQPSDLLNEISSMNTFLSVNFPTSYLGLHQEVINVIVAIALMLLDTLVKFSSVRRYTSRDIVAPKM